MLKIKNLKQVQKHFLKTIEMAKFRALQQFGEDKIKELQKRVPVATGTLKKSIGMKLKTGLRSKLQFFAKASYASFVNSGKIKSSLSDDRLFKIKRRVFEKGTKAIPFWDNTFEDIDKELRAIYLKEIK